MDYEFHETSTLLDAINYEALWGTIMFTLPSQIRENEPLVVNRVVRAERKGRRCLHMQGDFLPEGRDRCTVGKRGPRVICE